MFYKISTRTSENISQILWLRSETNCIFKEKGVFVCVGVLSQVLDSMGRNAIISFFAGGALANPIKLAIMVWRSETLSLSLSLTTSASPEKNNYAFFFPIFLSLYDNNN